MTRENFQISDDWDDEDLDISDDELEAIEAGDDDITVERYIAELKALAIKEVDKFFQDKMMHCGGKIPKALLHDEVRISAVMNYNISQGVDMVYESLSPLVTAEDKKAAKKADDSTWDIKLVNDTLNFLSRSLVKEQFAGGILLMYLEFIEGIEITYAK